MPMKQVQYTPKLDQLSIQQLNYCAARIEGYKFIHLFHHQVMVSNKKHESYDYNPCENPSRAYDIILGHGIGTEMIEHQSGGEWVASMGSSECYSGETPLHAAVKCYVAEYGGGNVGAWLEDFAKEANQ